MGDSCPFVLPQRGNAKPKGVKPFGRTVGGQLPFLYVAPLFCFAVPPLVLRCPSGSLLPGGQSSCPIRGKAKQRGKEANRRGTTTKLLSPSGRKQRTRGATLSLCPGWGNKGRRSEPCMLPKGQNNNEVVVPFGAQLQTAKQKRSSKGASSSPEGRQAVARRAKTRQLRCLCPPGNSEAKT